MKQGVACVVLFAALLAVTAAHAQGWRPDKNIEILIGLTAGSS
jgi:tripartite-type tricarboxylate transporter receptor subunit TctC